MPGVIVHAKTVAGSCTIASRVGPQDWTSAHQQSVTLAGNTLGGSTLSGTNIILSGGANITLSANGATIGILAGVGTHDSLNHSGNVLPGVDQYLGSAALSFGEHTLGGEPGTPAAGRAVVYAFDRFGRNVLRYKTPGGNTFQLAQDNVAVVRNQTGSSIAAFTPVYETGTGGSGEPLVAPANAAGESTMPAIGITVESIANGANGFIMLFGVITGVNTSGFAAGDVLYVAVGGGLTTTAPVIPNISQRVARILTSAVNGTALILSRSERNTHKGTIEDDWIIGNATTGSKRILFRGPTDYALRVSHTAGRTVDLPDASGTLALTGANSFLTTGALSNHSHGVTLNLTNLSGTTGGNSQGITLSLSAAAPGAAAESNWHELAGNTVGQSTISGSTIQLVAGNNITLSGVGASQIRIDAGAGGGGVAIQAGTVTITSGTAVFTGTQNITVSGNGQTVSISGPDLSPYLTTAMNSTEPHIRGLAGSNTTYTSGTVVLSGSRNITVGSAAGQIVITGPDLAPYLTTAALSNHSHGNPSLALTNLSGTTASNSAGLTLSLSASTYLTTAALSNHSHGNPSLALTNLSGTTASNSAGLTLSLSAGAGGAGGTQTFSVNGLSSITGTAVQVVFSNVTNVTLQQTTNGASMTLGFSGNPAGGGAAVSHSFFAPFDEAVLVAGTHGQGTMIIRPDSYPNVVLDRVAFRVNQSAQTGQTGTATLTMGIAFYTKNVSSISRLHSTTGTWTVPFSGTASNVTYAGQRVATVGWTTTITEGDYWIAIFSSTNSAGGNCSISQYVRSQVNTSFSGVWGVASNATAQRILGQGRYTAAGTTFPVSIAFSQIQGNSSMFQRAPAYYVISGSI
jgi:hypothetical protein